MFGERIPLSQGLQFGDPAFLGSEDGSRDVLVVCRVAPLFCRAAPSSWQAGVSADLGRVWIGFGGDLSGLLAGRDLRWAARNSTGANALVVYYSAPCASRGGRSRHRSERLVTGPRMAPERARARTKIGSPGEFTDGSDGLDGPSSDGFG